MARSFAAFLATALLLAGCVGERGPDPDAFGSPVVDGAFTFVVSGFECGSVEVSRGPIRKPATSQFCLLSLTIANSGDSARRFDFEAQELLDEGGIELRSDLEASLILNPEASALQIAPQASVSVRIVFDVANPVGIVAAHLHEGIFSDGVGTPVRP